MRLSHLQKYILLECLNNKGGKTSRSVLDKFYLGKKKKPKGNLAKIITQSLERMINREFLTGYGVRTSHKWFILEIKLTGKGRREAKRLLGEQMKLPFRLKYKTQLAKHKDL